MPALRPRRLRSPLAAATALLLMLPVPRPAAAVDIELVLAVDASTSVDYREFNLQMAGYAAAFRDRDFIAAVEAFAGGGLAISLLLWAGPQQSRVAIDWTIVRDGPTSTAFAETIDFTPRAVAGGSTALGDALAHAVELVRGNAIEGRRRIIDVSGDGRANDGTGVAAARARAQRLGIAINGLAILNEEPDLAGYYASAVITGPPAFVETAEGYDDFAAAIRRKLIREVRGVPVAAAPARGRAVAARRTLFAAPVLGIAAAADPVGP